MKSDEIRKLEARQAHHLHEAQRCADAIRLLSEIAAMTRKAERQITNVRARAIGPRGGRSESAVQRVRQKAGERPIDRVRRLFAEAGTDVLTVADITSKSGLSMPSIKGRFNNRVSPEGNLRRAIGLVLAQLAKRREIKATANGFVAAKLQFPANGAQP